MEYYKGDIDKAWIRVEIFWRQDLMILCLKPQGKGQKKKKKLKFFVRFANLQDTLIISINCY